MKFSFVTIGTKSLNESIEFYTKILGFHLDRRHPVGNDMEIAFLSDQQHMIEFVQGDNYPVYQGEGLSLGFVVSDIYETYNFMERNGVAISEKPRVIPSGVKLMQCRDLNGLTLGFVEFPKG
jgi:catechol 2,3-dioxygenase-like lactoylglutathione lyase family enzyme